MLLTTCYDRYATLNGMFTIGKGIFHIGSFAIKAIFITKTTTKQNDDTTTNNNSMDDNATTTTTTTTNSDLFVEEEE
jgi:hypothetical protein